MGVLGQYGHSRSVSRKARPFVICFEHYKCRHVDELVELDAVVRTGGGT